MDDGPEPSSPVRPGAFFIFTISTAQCDTSPMHNLETGRLAFLDLMHSLRTGASPISVRVGKTGNIAVHFCMLCDAIDHAVSTDMNASLPMKQHCSWAAGCVRKVGTV